MSRSSSHFQLLPCDIIEEIIEYFPPSSYLKADGKTKVAILHSCQSWRTAYMQKYLSALSVLYKENDEAVFSFESIGVPVDPLLYPINRFVRDLTITIPLWASVMGSEIVQWVQTSPGFASIDFSSVTVLTIYVPYDPKSTPDEGPKALHEERNIGAFFWHIKALIPNANDIKVLLPGCQRWFSTQVAIWQATRSIADLVCGRKFTFCDGKNLRCFPTINPGSFFGLTSICLDTKRVEPTRDTTRWALEVARRNSETLESITLMFFDLESIMDFLFCGGSPIIYTSLVKMVIAVGGNIQEALGTAAQVVNGSHGSHIEHFPKVKHLKFTGLYRRTIGLFFGPENRSLEYLDATTYIAYSDIEDNLFPADVLTRFYGLKTIRFGTDDKYGETSDHESEYKMMCSHILESFAGSSSAIYYITTEYLDSEIALELLDEVNLWSTLRRLHIPCTSFFLDEALDLLTKASVLQHLVCKLNNRSPVIDGVNLKEHPEYLKERHFPLSDTLSRFVVGYYENYDAESMHNVSWSALLLASLCPQLRHVGRNENIRKETKHDSIRIHLDRSASIAEQAESLLPYIANSPMVCSSLTMWTDSFKGIDFF